MRTTSRFLTTAPAALAAIALLAGCTDAADGGATGAPDQDADGAFPMAIENCGRQVTFEAPPQRVMALGGEAGGLLWAAGAVDRISTFSPIDGEPLGAAETALAALPQLEIPGSGDISREVIVGENPDLVVTFGLNQTTPEDLADAGIETLILRGYCDGSGAPEVASDDRPLQNVFADLEMLGDLLGTGEQAQAAVEDLQARVDAVREAASSAAPRNAAALFVSSGDSPLGAYGGRSMVDELMGYLGLTNIYADEPKRYFEPTVESFISGAPEVIVALYQASGNSESSALDALVSRPEIATVPAIENRDVLLIDFFYTGNGILAVDGLEMLADQLADL